jgi:hypothetical protein
LGRNKLNGCLPLSLLSSVLPFLDKLTLYENEITSLGINDKNSGNCNNDLKNKILKSENEIAKNTTFDSSSSSSSLLTSIVLFDF